MNSINLIRRVSSILYMFAIASSYGESNESWQVWPPGPYVYEGFVEMDPTFFYEVKREHQSEAITLLEHVEYLEITEGLAKKYAEEQYVVGKEERVYLIRAAYGHASGGYILHERGDDLFVLHVSAGKTSPDNKSALIVKRQGTIKNLYLGVNIGE